MNVMLLLVAALCGPAPPNDTAALQAAIDAGPVVTLEPRTYCVDGAVGLRLAGGNDIRLGDATIELRQGCATGRCKVFETLPGASNITISGGTLVGIITTGLGFEIGFRISRASNVLVEGTTIRDMHFDGVWIGDDSRNVTLRNLRIERSGRNGISVVDASGVLVEDVEAVDTLPGIIGAGIDVEPNAGDWVEDITIRGGRFSGNVVGLYLQAGKGGGARLRVVGVKIEGNSKFGLIGNSLLGYDVYDSDIVAGPTGQAVSFGGTATARAREVVFVGNRVTGAFKLAGVDGLVAVGNPGLEPQPVALGVIGPVLVWNNEVTR